MKEKDYYNAVGKYYLENTTYEAVEVKITKTNRLSFSCLPEHQESALLNAWYYKIPDVGISKKPLDIVFKRNEAPLVAIYYKPDNTQIFEIPIRAWVNEAYGSGDKSLTLERAAEIGCRVDI